MNLVYGLWNSGYLVFAPEERAAELKQAREALAGARTWGEFQAAMPAALWADVEDNFEDAEEALPPADAPFDADAVPGFADGDWPEYLPGSMLEWVPDEIQRTFGRDTASGSPMAQDFLALPAAREAEIVAAFEAKGYTCRRDDALVEAAMGLD